MDGGRDGGMEGRMGTQRRSAAAELFVPLPVLMPSVGDGGSHRPIIITKKERKEENKKIPR